MWERGAVSDLWAALHVRRLHELAGWRGWRGHLALAAAGFKAAHCCANSVLQCRCRAHKPNPLLWPFYLPLAAALPPPPHTGILGRGKGGPGAVTPDRDAQRRHTRTSQKFSSAMICWGQSPWCVPSRSALASRCSCRRPAAPMAAQSPARAAGSGRRSISVCCASCR